MKAKKLRLVVDWNIPFFSYSFVVVVDDVVVTPPRNRGGVIFLLQFVCLCVCVCVCVCLSVRLLTKCRSNRYTDFDAVFAKQLLTAVARTLLKLVTLG